jgi:hypothetical protein
VYPIVERPDSESQATVWPSAGHSGDLRSLCPLCSLTAFAFRAKSKKFLTPRRQDAKTLPTCERVSLLCALAPLRAIILELLGDQTSRTSLTSLLPSFLQQGSLSREYSIVDRPDLGESGYRLVIRWAERKFVLPLFSLLPYCFCLPCEEEEISHAKAPRRCRPESGFHFFAPWREIIRELMDDQNSRLLCLLCSLLFCGLVL